MNELERLERQLLESLSRGDLNAAGRLLREDFLITTAGWIAEPVGKQAWLDELAGRLTLQSFDLRLVATQEFGHVAVAIVESAQEGPARREAVLFDLPLHRRVGAARSRLGARDTARLDRSAPVGALRGSEDIPEHWRRRLLGRDILDADYERDGLERRLDIFSELVDEER